MHSDSGVRPETTLNSNSSQLGRQALDGTIRVFLAEALILPTGLLTIGFLSRQLRPDGFGLFALAATLVVWIEVSIDALFSRATVKFVGEAQDWRPIASGIMRLYLAVSSAAAVTLWLLAAPIAGLLNEPALTLYLQLFALDIPVFSLAHAHRDILIGIGRFRQRALATTGRWLVRLALIVILVGLGLSVEGAILGTIGASLVELAICRIYVRPSLFQRSTLPASKLRSYAAPLFLSAVSIFFYERVDLFALKALGGTAMDAGLYGAAQSLALVPGLFAVSFSPLLLSSLSRLLGAGEVQRAEQMARHGMRVTIMLLPFAGMTAGAAPDIIGLVFGSLFLPAAPLLGLLIFAMLAVAMIWVGAAIVTAAGKPRSTLAVAGPLVPLAIVGHLVVIPVWGPTGAALVTTIVAGLGGLAAVVAVRLAWRVWPPVSTVWRSTLVCVLAYALGTIWQVPAPLVPLKITGIGLFIPLCFLLLRELTASEIALARSMFSSPRALEANLERL